MKKWTFSCFSGEILFLKKIEMSDVFQKFIRSQRGQEAGSVFAANFVLALALLTKGEFAKRIGYL